MTPTLLLTQGFVLGLIGGFVPGAIMTILLVSVLRGGWRSGLPVLGWAIVAETVFATVLLLIVIQIPLSTSAFDGIALLGACVLIWLAAQIWKLQTISVDTTNKATFSAKQIFLLTATNAPPHIFWLTVCFPLIWQLAAEWGMSQAAVSYLLVFECGWALSTTAVLFAFVFVRRWLVNPRVMGKVFAALALLLLGFAVQMALGVIFR